jgi:hypothetical protein
LLFRLNYDCSGGCFGYYPNIHYQPAKNCRGREITKVLSIHPPTYLYYSILN